MTTTKHIDSTRITLRELEDKEFEGAELSEIETEALRLFREMRLNKLKKNHDREEDFHSKYEYFRELSNVLDYKEFLAKRRFSFNI